MNLQHAPSHTLDDGLLVRHLHDELDAGERAALLRHLDACDQCRVRLASLEARMRRISSALVAADFDEPADDEWRAMLAAALGRPGGHAGQAGRATGMSGRGASRARLAAGIVLAIAAAALLGSAPLRAWIGAQLDALADGRDQTAIPAPAAPTTQGAPSGVTAALAFRPTGSTVDIVLQATQPAGTLRVRFTDQDETARVAVTGGGTEQLTVGGSGVRIANAADAAASYDVVVPRAVSHVAITVGAHAPVTLARDGRATAAFEFDLSQAPQPRQAPR